MISIALFLGLVLCIILSFIPWIKVLISMFKNAGALQGILGFFFGIYAFIWGWLKHKQFELTKTMVLWSVLTVASIALVPAIIFSGTMEIMSYAQKYAGDLDIALLKEESKKDQSKFKSPKKRKVQKAATKYGKTKKLGQRKKQNADWSQKAMGLWANGKYKNPKKAVDYWSRAISSRQNTVEAYNNRGLAYHELKQYEKAIDDFSQAIKMDPAHVAAYNNRGNAYYEMNEYELALMDFNRSLKRKPDYAKAHLNRGLVYYQMDQTDRACNDFQNACDHGDCDGTKWAMMNAVCK